MQISNQSIDAWLDMIQDDRGDDFRVLDPLISEVFAGAPLLFVKT